MNDIKKQKFLVIDFETVTPAGFPAQPIQLGIVEVDYLGVSEVKKKSWFISPPDFAPLTWQDTMQTGITMTDLKNAKSAETVFDSLEDICSREDYILVAQNAIYEWNIIQRYIMNRPNLKKIKIIDTIKLAKLAYPSQSSYKLDRIAQLLNIDIPMGRHNALVDCILTGKVFLKLLNILNLDIPNLLKYSCINLNPSYSQLSLFSDD